MTKLEKSGVIFSLFDLVIDSAFVIGILSFSLARQIGT
jgi:hypothetical protein